MENKKGIAMNKEQMREYLDGPTKLYAVYQVPFENDLIRDVGFMSAEQIQEVSDQYELVGTVQAVDLEQVFFYGNIQREKFTVLGEMVSVSTGNIIEDVASGETFVVEMMGFKQITMKEAA
jgi:hypothetical protein